MSNDPRPVCPACALKHLAASWAWHEFDTAVGVSNLPAYDQAMFCLCKARIQWNEFLSGYEGHDMLAMGWMAVAEEIVRGIDKEMADGIRGARKDPAQRGRLLTQPPNSGMMSLAHLTEAMSEGNMDQEAPDLSGKACSVMLRYLENPADRWPRELIEEYRKLYEL